MDLKEFLTRSSERKASDIFIVPNHRPMLYVHDHLLEDDACEIGIFLSERYQRFGVCADRNTRLRGLFLSCIESAAQLLDGCVDDFAEQGLLVAEMQIKGAGRDAGALGDLVAGNSVKSVGGEQLAAAGEKASASCHSATLPSADLFGYFRFGDLHVSQ